MADVPNDYVVGRGRLFFGQFRPGTRKARPQNYFGNTPELSLAQDEDTLDHYSSEGGVRVKDASVTLQNDSSGSFQCDNISDRNLALWFRGIILQRIEAGSAVATGTVTFSVAPPAAGDTITIDEMEVEFVDAADVPMGMQVRTGATLAATAVNLANFINDTPALGVTATAANSITTIRAIGAGAGGNAITLAKSGANIAVSGATLTGGTDVTETLAGVERGGWHQLGVSDTLPQGVNNVGIVTIAGVDEDSYVVERGTGRIYIKPDAADVVDGANLEVSYGITGGVEDVVIARGESIEGEMKFIANNAAGTNRDYYWPYVRLTPDGDFSLKGDEWQNMTFNFEILKRDEIVERQYITKRAATLVA